MIVHQIRVRNSSHLSLCSTQYSLDKQHGGRRLSGRYASGTVQIDFILCCDCLGGTAYSDLLKWSDMYSRSLLDDRSFMGIQTILPPHHSDFFEV